MIYKISEIATVVAGATPSTEIKENYYGDIYWITPKDLSNNKGKKYIRDCERKITKQGFQSCSTTMIPANNILISTRAPIGYIAINSMDCCTNQGFKSLVCNNKFIDVDFLYYYLSYKMKEIEALGSGTTFKEVSKNSIENFEIDVPNLEVQIKISKILAILDNQIERNTAMVKKLQVLGKAIYSRNIDQINFTKLRLVSSITTGKEDANHATSNGKYKFFTCSNDILSCDDFKFEGESVLVAGNGDFNVKFYNGRFNAYQRTYVIKNDAIIGNLFFTLLFNTELFKKKAQGSIIKFITIDMLNKIDVPMFSDCVNLALNKVLSKLDGISKSTESLQMLKNNILPLLINQQLV